MERSLIDVGNLTAENEGPITKELSTVITVQAQLGLQQRSEIGRKVHVVGSRAMLRIVSLPIADEIATDKGLESSLIPAPVIAYLETSVRLNAVVVAGSSCRKTRIKNIPLAICMEVPAQRER